MAGGKLSARQRMINLMYLVFIAMMAMQMSKEVLTAFGNMKEKFSESNTLATESNKSLLANLILKGEEKPDEFLAASGKAQEVSKISNEFYSYLEGISNNLITIGGYKVEEKSGKYDYEKMADDDIFNESWFNGDSGLTPEGQEVVDIIEKYKTDIIKIISPKIGDSTSVEGDDAKYLKFIETFERRFNIDDVYVNTAETTQDWLFANFNGFPAVAIYTKLAAMQNDIKVTETALYNLFLGNTLTEAVTLKNYQAIVLPEKGSFFTGETFKGKVALGKYASVAPIELVVNQQDVNLNAPGTINEDGSVELKFNVGSKLGDQPIDGTFTFYEDGEPLEIPIVGNYVVVNKPNKATISADKLNVVYVGIDNELTISVPGVNNKDVIVTAPGLTSLGNGKYTLYPPALKRGQKAEVKINVSATLEGGDKFNDSKIFKIYGLPTPIGKINNKSGGRLTKEDLTGNRLIADIGNFPYELKGFRVSAFSLKIEGRAPIAVQGERLNQKAIAAVNTARRGSRITISNITTTRGGLKIQFPQTTSIVGELN
jgi:gliding motility-associated protein GldM